MKKIIAISLLAFAVACVPQPEAEEFTGPYPLPFTPAPGDSTLPCQNEGPPVCRAGQPGFWKCIDACGEGFIVIEYELDGGNYTQCLNYQGDIYDCNGTAQP